ncbi:MAG: hypothetical protein DRJ43_03965 [Thermoprotei archaeon]|nr:MAG: hypothetical protein DRJ43_03965 [Thermoprotei archaeon]
MRFNFERYIDYLSYSIRPICSPIDYGDGVYIYTTDGEKILDFNSQIQNMPLGHCHPAIINAVIRQARRLLHNSSIFWQELRRGGQT